MSLGDTGDEEPPIFSALTVHLKLVHESLRCLISAGQALVTISPSGIRFSVETARSCQGHVNLDAALFSRYDYNGSATDPAVCVNVELKAMLEVLGLYNSAISPSSFANNGGGDIGAGYGTNALRIGGTMRLMYERTGEPLVMVLEEAEVVTRCKLTTYEPSSLVDMRLQSVPPQHKIILKKSTWLHEAITELERGNGKELIIRQSPFRPYFRLASEGIHGRAQMDYPNDRDVLEVFECESEARNVYHFALIRHAYRAMGQATKVSLRTDDRGVLSMQFLLSFNEKESFVEYRFVPLADDDEEEEDEDVGSGGVEATEDDLDRRGRVRADETLAYS
ncbi:checkpoint clamp complex protein Rad1 [Savitreella phatthalungensis]